MLRRRLSRALAALFVVSGISALSAPARADSPPQLEWGKPVRCMVAPGGERVRVQCDGAARRERCLVAPNAIPGLGDELDQVQPCASEEPIEAYRALAARGARMVRAVAEAPPGYARAENGRAYQVKFDLLNRLYLGASWAPTFQPGIGRIASPPGFPFGRAQAEVGVRLSVLSPAGRARHDIRFLEGRATFSDLELSGLLFSYDYQHRHRRPLFWLTTFFGEPEVHPIPSRLGWGLRVLKINDRPPGSPDTLDVEISEAHIGWNPWQSDDMYNHLRIEAGGDVGKYWQDRARLADGLDTGVWYAGFSGAIRSRFSLGQGGLHYLFVDFDYRRPTVLEGELTGASVNRVDASIAYEGVLLAINDQPVSLRLAALGSSRNDIVPASRDVRDIELRMTAGLRFSFWSPPRLFEPLQEYEDP